MKNNFSSLSEEMKQNGFVRIKNVLSDKDVNKLREFSLTHFSNTNTTILTPSEFLGFEKLSEIPFSDNIIQVTKDVLDVNYTFTPTFTVRKSLYIQWHTDDFFLSNSLEALTDLPEFLMSTIYLQTNNAKTGGGIEFVPESHRLHLAEREKMMNQGIENYYLVENEPGDLIIFDYRIIHRGTIPAEKAKKTRLAIQWFISRSTTYVDVFLNFLLRRRYEKMHLADKTDSDLTRYFHDLSNIKFPESFPEIIVQKIRTHHLNMKCIKNIDDPRYDR